MPDLEWNDNLGRLPHRADVSWLGKQGPSCTMNAYLFSAVTTRSQVRPTPGRYGTVDTIQTWDACGTQIVFGDSPEEAQKLFETWLRATPEGENPVKVT